MKILFLKNISNNSISNNVIARLEKGEKGYYYFDEANCEKINTSRDTVNRLFKNRDNESIPTILLIYEKKTNNFIKAYYGLARLHEYSINLEIENFKTLEQSQINAIEKLYLRNFEIELKKVSQYVFVNEIQQNDILEIIYGKMNYIQTNYKSLNNYNHNKISEFIKNIEKNYNPLAQKSPYIKRPIGYKKSAPFRSEFQRDKERIIHSKAFRRMVDKAQIYTSSKGDHYRTRLTHTLEVAQIARGIGRSLNLNEDLIEAIALGHDIGHTPFGHEGERELNLILSKTNDTSYFEKENFGGFKHNYQGIKVLNYLEEKYPEIEGLDISYQVLEGVLKHTKIKKCNIEDRKCPECKNSCYEIDEFLKIGDKKYLYLEHDFPTTLEGQIVKQADEIAQRGHDLDDGISSNVLNFEELIEELKNQTVNMKSIIEILENGLSECKNEKRRIIDKRDMERAIIVPRILGFFMENLITTSEQNIKQYTDSKLEFFNKNHIVDKELICFNSEISEQLDVLEKLIKSKIINSFEVNCFDGKASYTIRKLFKAYFSNPRQLPDGVLLRITKEIENYKIKTVNIRNGSIKEVNNEIEIFQGKSNSNNRYEDFIKKRIYLRCIVDHIGGMTDNYANESFKKLYLPK